MDIRDAETPELETHVSPDAVEIPAFDVDVATVCMVDGIWQDQPDNVAAFVEARLGDLAHGRGNLYICLDVSGEVEGRGEIERALVEVIRDTYAASRGSISFGLSEAMRAANAYLYDSNRQVQRELRRMAGAGVAVLRGNDLYICQSGPAVVYVEAGEKLARYPAESDWFVEDAPLIAPQGSASAPLGIRREFASDLAHTSVTIGDVFVLATRALTQLATTEELAIAFTERSAQEIAAYLEELGQDADLTALVAELMPHAQHRDADALGYGVHNAPIPEPHIESFPVPLDALVVVDENEPPLESPVDAEPEAEPTFAFQSPQPLMQSDAEIELRWDDDEIPETEQYEQGDAETQETAAKIEPAPVYAAAAAMAMPRAPAYLPPGPEAPDYDAELERRRAERAARRAEQKEDIQRAFASVLSALAVGAAAIGGVWERMFGGVDWERTGKRTNRGLNIAIGALISFFLLLVRLVLPGAPAASTKIVPRRATSDPWWLRAFALFLPVLMIGLALGAFWNQRAAQQQKFEALVAQADTLVKQAEVNPDHAQALEQLQDARKIIREAQTIQDSKKARDLLNRIQDHQDEIDGVAILRFLPAIAQVGSGAQLAQIAASDQDIFLLDRQNRVYQYTVNDATGDAKPTEASPVILKQGDDVDGQKVGTLLLLASAPRGQDKPLMVAASNNALLAYDLGAKKWTAYAIQDTDKWGELRAIDGFSGNIYLLDAANNQIYKYAATAAGYSPKAALYFPADAAPVLSKAVDMTIDGDVWILNDNGTVLRFRAGKAIAFELEALPTPLKNAVAIYTRPETDSLYIADAGNQRILEFDKNGKFVRSFKPYAEKGGLFRGLQDFTVNETKRKLYFLNTDAAYMANLAK